MDRGVVEEWAAAVIDQLSRSGVIMSPGLRDRDVEEVDEAFGVPLPEELVCVLRAGVPASPKWARWWDGPKAVARDAREWIDNVFRFDIEQGQYWHPTFGERPEDDSEAVHQALAIVHAAPPLIPIYAHRFLTTTPANGPRAVLSVWQPIDSIVYGNDLADYFAREFKIDRPTWATTDQPPVPVREDLFDLFCVGQ